MTPKLPYVLLISYHFIKCPLFSPKSRPNLEGGAPVKPPIPGLLNRRFCLTPLRLQGRAGLFLEAAGEHGARVPKLMQNASFVCVVVGAFSHIFLQIFNSTIKEPIFSLKKPRNPYSPWRSSSALVRSWVLNSSDLRAMGGRTDGRTDARTPN